ncbi:MAG: T9SS type A sorting domain-containing protein [Flavobacteriales bacterium]|nr:T9SS type A sorting domain-containing protein [Flavobacteriales bacterium]
MKTLSTFAIGFLITGGLHAQIALDSGLVAHWELDNNALDAGPNFFNGTAVGPVAAEDRFGVPASAYQFNGTSDYVDLPTVFTTPPEAVTFSAWFRVPITYPEGKLIHHADKGEFSMYTDSNALVVAVHLGTDLPNGWIWTSQKFGNDHWHFAAGRWEYGQSLELYFDGVIVASVPAPDMAMMDPGPNFLASLGKYRYSGVSYYAGLLDDVRIYDRALSNAELDSLNGNFSTAAPQQPASTGVELFQNQPNPASSSTTITFEQPTAGPVSLRVYDLNGKLLTELENATLPAGKHSYTVDLSNVGAGVYFCELRSNGSVLTRKLLVE